MSGCSRTAATLAQHAVRVGRRPRVGLVDHRAERRLDVAVEQRVVQRRGSYEDRVVDVLSTA
jgi:hypothetical protein